MYQNSRQRFPVTVPSCDGSLSLPKLNVYGKDRHPQGNHLHQRQGGGGLRQADTGGNEPPRQRAEPHGHRGSIPKSV